MGCQIEEYPWGSGNPNRHVNNKIWNEQAVLRLIPEAENTDHGNALSQFYREHGGDSGYAGATDLIYSVSFVGAPSGTLDDSYYLGSDLSHNKCAEPYGNEFILVNKASVNQSQRQMDPW